MIEGIAISSTADILVWVITGTAGSTLALQLYLIRATKQNQRLLTGEDGVESDNGLIEQSAEHEQRLDSHEQRINRHATIIDNNNRQNND